MLKVILIEIFDFEILSEFQGSVHRNTSEGTDVIWSVGIKQDTI